MNLMDRDLWQNRLLREESIRGYHDGFKFIYCPWSVIGKSHDLLLSLNPGKPPHGAALRTVSDERGNSYVVERFVTNSPITAQVLKFCDLIDTPADEFLMGVIMPFRTSRWQNSRDKRNLDIGREFWGDLLRKHDYRRIFCLGKDTEREIVDLLSAELKEEIPSGWGNLSIRSYNGRDGSKIYGLLHFSTFKMMSNTKCLNQLEKLIDI